MLVFPSSKINLGLNIIEKRQDGFHNIESVFYSINWCDALEITEGKGSEIEIFSSGLKITGNQEDNIIYKAFNLLKQCVKLPPLKVFLHKTIPMGAGLGGGSSDAVHFLKALDKKFDLKLNLLILKGLSSELGSDCSFFIENKPVFATQKGERLESINLDLSPYYIFVVFPQIHCNTKEAYNGITPQKPTRSAKEIVLNEPVKNWKSLLVNDFEKPIFQKFPEINNVKEAMYKNGAIYASMSGSGSSVFGIFEERPSFELPKNYLFYLQEAIR